MKIRFGIKMTALAFLIVFMSTMAGYIVGARSMYGKRENGEIKASYQEEGKAAQEVSVEKNMPSADKESHITEGYILRENDEGLSLFVRYKDGREEVYHSYDVFVPGLPERDRELLREGIFVPSLSEALSLAEDYSS